MIVSFRKLNWLTLLALVSFNVQVAYAQDEVTNPITSLAEFNQLGEEAIGRNVDIEASVTHVEPVWGCIFVQDGEDAVFVSNVDVKDIKFGDRLKIVGEGERGDVRPLIQAKRFDKLPSDSPPPEPLEIKFSELEIGDLDGRFVSVEATVKRAVSGVGHVLLFCEEAGVEFHVSMVGSKTAEEMWTMIGSRMRFVGALGVTLEPGTESLAIGRNYTMFRLANSQEPEFISSKNTEPFPRWESDSTTDNFLLAGQVTMHLGDFFTLSQNQTATRIEFPKIQGVTPAQTSRVVGNKTTDESNKTIYNALIVEALFISPLPFAEEFQNVDVNERLWRYVTVSGHPENIRAKDDQIVFEINRAGQQATVVLGELVTTSINLLENTKRLEVTGTVIETDGKGDCTVFVPKSESVLLLEPAIPVWKYIVWALLPITALFSIGFLWVKSQRNQAASQAKEISEMHTRLVSTYRAINDGLLAIDNDNRVLAVNPEFCKLFGRELVISDQITLENCEEFFSRIKDSNLAKDIIFKSHAGHGEIGIELEVVDSKPLIYELKVSDIFANDKTTIGKLLVMRDRTSEKELQAELIHSNKIEAVGQLVGGIAHDFNNILTTIMANLSLLNLASVSDDKMKARIADAEMATNRGADLVRRLLTYSGKTELKPNPYSINKIISELHKFARATFDARYEFDFDLDDCDPIVFVDSAAIEQVILNLYLNARDAMPDGGKISVKTRLTTDSDDPMVCIWVSDNGRGISKPDLDRIFEPFFTTKAGQAGTGLGLFTSKRLVQDQQGELKCESLPDLGTCFLLRLPSADMAAKPASPQHFGVENAASANKTVLIVDDEDSIRYTCKLILESQGYKVLTAPNGEAALTLLRSKEHQIDIVLLDLTMPGISGLEVLEIATTEFPDIPVVLCSGYLAGVSESLRDDSLTLPKPFSAGKLLSTVGKSLASDAAG